MADDSTGLSTSAQQTVIAINKLNETFSTFNTGLIDATRMPALTGDVTTVGGTVATTIANDAVTTAKILDANVTQAKLGTNVAGTGPAFYAYLGSAQTINTGADTKVTINTENFDTGSMFDPTTNYRFTATVAGYYLILGRIGTATAGVTRIRAALYKSGSLLAYGSDFTSTQAIGSNVHAIVQLNASQYIELYGQPVGANAALSTTNETTYLSGCLIRSN